MNKINIFIISINIKLCFCSLFRGLVIVYFPVQMVSNLYKFLSYKSHWDTVGTLIRIHSRFYYFLVCTVSHLTPRNPKSHFMI